MAQIRLAQAADVPAIRELVRAAYAIYVPRIGREPAPVTADYKTLVDAGAVWVATKDEEIAGVLVLQPTAESLLLENVAVRPDRQRRGVGRMLIAFAEQEAARRGFDEVSLYTNAHMTENLSLYPALGYVEVARKSEHGFERVFFRKQVAARRPSAPRGRRP
jgi:N-acetylglutamate synthase-like GNAT family acetyltransferase